MEKIKRAFSKYPAAGVLYQSSDGNVFLEQKKAKRHKLRTGANYKEVTRPKNSKTKKAVDNE